MDYIRIVAEIVISSGIVAAVLTFMISKKLESIKNDNRRTLERLRTYFQIEMERARAAYSEIYKVRLEVIGKCHEMLLELQAALHKYTNWIEIPEKDGTKDDRFKNLLETARNFRSYYLPNRLYLTEKIEIQIDGIITEISRATINFYTRVQDRETERGTAEEWDRIASEIEQSIDPALDLLRSEMRKVLDPPNRFIHEEEHEAKEP